MFNDTDRQPRASEQAALATLQKWYDCGVDDAARHVGQGTGIVDCWLLLRSVGPWWAQWNLLAGSLLW